MKVVGLLRGINVGNSIRVSMIDLKKLLEDSNFKNVETYLNSGNVLFDTTLELLEAQKIIDRLLSERYGQPIPLLLLSASDIIAVRNAIPPEWENSELEQTYVAYLFPQVDQPGIIRELPVKHHLIQFIYVKSAIIWNIKRENYNKSQITKIAKHPSYGLMTTRNVNTARKLAEMCEDV